MQFLYDLKILRTNHQCPMALQECVPMALQECPATKYREGCCWKCKCGKTITPRVGSNLENSHVTYEEFIKILAEGESVTSAAQHGNLAKDTVRRFYNKIHQRIAEDLITQTKIGGPVTVVEIDESKFGKQFSGRRGTARCIQFASEDNIPLSPYSS